MNLRDVLAARLKAAGLVEEEPPRSELVVGLKKYEGRTEEWEAREEERRRQEALTSWVMVAVGAALGILVWLWVRG